MAWRMVAEVFCTKCLYSGKFFLVALCSFSLVDEESWALQLCNWKCACKGTSGVGRAAFQIIW